MATQIRINWKKACPSPIALVILPWGKGYTVARRGADNKLYGCRDVSRGPSMLYILKAWCDDAREKGLRLEIDPTLAADLLD